MSPGNHHGGWVIILTLLTALVLTLLPLPETVRYLRPQWYTLVLIYWTLALPQRVGVLSGFILGLFVDVATATLLGQHALALSLIAFITLKTHQRVRLFPLWQQSLTILPLLLIERLIGLWVTGAVGQPIPDFSYWASPLIGTLLWPWIYIVLRDLRRRFQVN